MTDQQLHDYLIDEINHDGHSELLQQSEGQIEIFDDIEGKYITLRTKPITEDEIRNIIHFGPSFPLDKIAKYQTAIARNLTRLTRLEPHALMCVKHIFIVNAATDLKPLCDKVKADEELLPEALLDEDEELAINLVGVHWDYESTPIINVAAITATSEDLYEPEETGLIQREIEIGFWTTLLHEIRHNQVESCPYDLPWIKPEDMGEQAIESWALKTFENW